MKKKHLVLTATTLSLTMTFGTCRSYAGTATSLAAWSVTEANTEHREGTVGDTAGATIISANGSVITVAGDGAVAANGTVTIQRIGTYMLHENFAGDQLVMGAGKGAGIKLAFDDFTINNSTNTPLIFESGMSVTTVLQDGTENAVPDLRGNSEGNKAAIYAESDPTISGNGTLAVQGNTEDTIYSEANITVEGSALILEAGDDGIHAGGTLTVRNGNINVTESEEGLEGLVVDIRGGVIAVTARGDGINTSDGAGSDVAPGQATEGAAVRISGDMVTVKTGGDSIDSSRDLTISDSTAVVDDPSDGRDAPFDYDDKGVITGGTVFVTGDSGMSQTLSDNSSTQKSLVISLNSTQGVGTKMKIADSEGNVVYENTTTTQTFNTLPFGTADLKQDENYTVTVGSRGRTVTVSDSTNINSKNGGSRGASGSRPEGRPDGQRPGDRSENGGRQDNCRNGRGERNGRPNGRGQQDGDAPGESRDGEVRDDRGAEQRGDGQRPEGRSENSGQQGGRDQNGERPEGGSESSVRQGGRGQNDNRPEGRSENGVRQDGKGQNDNYLKGKPENGARQGDRSQDGNRPGSGLENGDQQSGGSQNERHPEGRPKSGDRQGSRGQNGKRPEGRPENEGQQDDRGQNGKYSEDGSENSNQQGGRGQNGKRPEGKPKNGSQQGGRGQSGKRLGGGPKGGSRQDDRGQNGKRPKDRPKNDGQQGKQCGKRSVDDNDKSKGTYSYNADCSCRAR